MIYTQLYIFKYSYLIVIIIMISNYFLMSRVFTNGQGDQGSIPRRVIPKTQKIVLNAALLNTQHYKVRIKGKLTNSGNGVAPPLHLVVVTIEKGTFGSPSTTVANLVGQWYMVSNNK